MVIAVLFVGGVQLWLKEKSYVFSADDLASITKQALNKTKGEWYIRALY